MIDSPMQSLAGSVREFIATFAAVGELHHWDPEDGSPSVTDWSANELDADPAWGPQPLQDAYRTGFLVWPAISDLALAFADLVDPCPHPYAVMAVARGLAEACGRAYYLLESDLDPAERVRRMLNDRQFGLLEQRLTARHMPIEIPAWLTDVRDAIQAAAQKHNLGQVNAEQMDKFKSARIGKPRPRNKEVVQLVVGHADFGGMFYGLSSAISHAAMHGLVAFLKLTPSEQGLIRAATAPVDAQEAATRTSAAVVALATAIMLMAHQSGWDDPELADASERMTDTWDVILKTTDGTSQ
jgi:hypothetical protein